MQLGFGLGLTSVLPVSTAALDPDAAIAALFSSGEVGAWYDPSDSTTVFQDATGRTPAAVGDPVGLILDKSKGLTLGSEIVTNGTFDNATGWSVSAQCSIAGGVANLISSDGSFQQVAQNKSLTGGKTYQLQFDVTRITSGAVSFSFSGAGVNIPNVANSTGTYTLRFFVASTVSSSLAFYRSGVTDASLDNISVRELPGNHATQTTSAARPVLQQSGGLYYLDFDGVDDSMAVTFASAQAQPNSVSVGYKLDAVANTIIIDGSTTDRHVLYISTGDMAYFAGTAVVTAEAATSASNKVAVLSFDSPSSSIRLDGVVISSGDDVGSLSWGGVKLGSRYNDTQFTNGRIYSFVGVNRTLDPDETASVERYLGTKSGFAAPVITGVPTIA